MFLVVKNCKLEYVHVYRAYNMITKTWGSGGGVTYTVLKGFICKQIVYTCNLNDNAVM